MDLPLSLGLSVALALFVTVVDFFRCQCGGCATFMSPFPGTPLVAQLFCSTLASPSICQVFVAITKMQAVVLGLGFNAGAYMRERASGGAILSVDKGQLEAAYSIGMSDMKVMWRIILPQAVVVAIPPLVNNLVDILKGSSLAFTVGDRHHRRGRLRASANFKYFHALSGAHVPILGACPCPRAGTGSAGKEASPATGKREARWTGDCQT